MKLLLSVDGTENAYHAAQLCWGLAKNSGISLTAQYVVDAVGLWEFLGHDLPGLVGSGPYLAANEVMRKELLVLGQTVMDMYETLATSNGVSSHVVIDEGSMIKEICTRAADHDLVVVGQRIPSVSSPLMERRKLRRHTIAQKLAYSIDRPLLIVQGPVSRWDSITLACSAETQWGPVLDGCFQLASTLSTPIEASFVTPSYQRRCTTAAPYERLYKATSLHYPNVRSSCKRLSLPVEWWTLKEAFPFGSLVVVPVSNGKKGTKEVLGVPLDVFTGYFAHSNILLWPEDCQLSLKTETASQSGVTARPPFRSHSSD